MKNNYDYVIIGTGPSGLAAAYSLVKNHNIRPLLIDAGNSVRIPCPANFNNNCINCDSCCVSSGFGGCMAPGTAAKLVFPPCGKRLLQLFGNTGYQCLAEKVWDFYSQFAQIKKPYPATNPLNVEIEKLVSAQNLNFF